MARIIHGKPRHPETQGSVERANQDIKRHLTAMMFESGSNSWVCHVRQVQYKKNTAFHSTIGMSPFQALVHRKPPMGLSDLGIPAEIHENIRSEQDLDQVVQEINSEQPDTPIDLEEIDNSHDSSLSKDISPIFQLYSHSDAYMEEISLPSSSNIQIFGDNQALSLYGSEDPALPPVLGLSKFPPVYDTHSPPPPSIDQVTTQEPTHSHSQDYYSESLVEENCAECNLETLGAHRCPGCHQYMHIICGRSTEEGYGAGVW